MAKKIVQLENNDGDQIFPISATDIALPGTKVAMRSASDPVTISTTRVSIVSTTVDSDGDYLAIGSVSAGSGSQEAIYCYAFIDNGTDSTTYVTNISTIPTGRPCMTVMGKITGLHQGDTVRLSAQTQSSSYSTQSRDQSLALIKLPTGAPTYKGGALNVTLNAGGTWSGATTLEMYNALRTGKQVIFDGPFFDSGHAILLAFNDAGLVSWGIVVEADSGIMYRIRFDERNNPGTWYAQELMDPGYSTYEVKTGQHWTDGKPIYKKTVSYTVGDSHVSPVDIPTGITYGGHLVKLEGSVHVASTGQYYPLTFGDPMSWMVAVRQISSGLTSVRVACNSNQVLQNSTWDITLYYTKTTD